MESKSLQRVIAVVTYVQCDLAIYYYFSKKRRMHDLLIVKIPLFLNKKIKFICN
jgi:hypothetical protein